MKISVIEGHKIKDQAHSAHLQKYNDFVLAHQLGTIHQLSDWGLFQTKSGLVPAGSQAALASKRDQFWIVTVEDNGASKIVASALIIRQNLPFNKCWLYCPRGPLFDYSNPKITTAIFAKIAELAKEQNAVFFRFDPAIAPTLPAAEGPAVAAARPAHAHYQPESTLIIDLKPAPNLILAQMKQKGRYNIRVAQKHGVNVRCATTTTTSAADIQAFYQLLSQTTTRDNFSGHPLKYYQNMLSTLGPKQAKLYLAEYTPPDAEIAPAPASAHASSLANSHPQILAAAIVTYFGETATYYFGASSNQNRHTMAPYLLHWQIMLDAKAAGYKFYDMFGISPEPQPVNGFMTKIFRKPKPHPWASVTDFKLKFGGTRVNYTQAQEIVYQPLWFKLILISKYLFRLIKRLRKI